jgi:MoxR-like ATPase
MRLTLGYPPYQEEKRVLMGEGGNKRLSSLSEVLSPGDLVQLQEDVAAIQVEDSVLDYLLRIVVESRRHPSIKLGVSPRGALSFLACVRGRAFLEERDFVIPEDVRQMAIPVMAHRLILQPEARYAGANTVHIVEELLSQIEVPR